MQLFQLCESSESEEKKYFFFNAKWNYEFYKSWCYNQGGEIATPVSADEYQKQLDIADRLIVPDLHEKCVKAGGSIIIWMGYNDMELEGHHPSLSRPQLTLLSRRVEEPVQPGAHHLGGRLEARPAQRGQAGELHQDGGQALG